jgi:ribosomal protein L10
MSKQVKELLTRDLTRRLDGVPDCVVANVVGMDAISTTALRKRLREKNISVMVIKNSLARRATEGTSLAPAFEGLSGTAAVVWGGEDFISLVKEIVELDKDPAYEEFVARGGVMDGEALDADKVRQMSKWPNRLEQLSILSGQLTAPWTRLQSQLLGPGGQLASQIEKKSKDGEG